MLPEVAFQRLRGEDSPVSLEDECYAWLVANTGEGRALHYANRQIELLAYHKNLLTERGVDSPVGFLGQLARLPNSSRARAWSPMTLSDSTVTARTIDGTNTRWA